MPVNSFEDYPMSWKPQKSKLEKPYYLSIAASLEADILSGKLPEEALAAIRAHNGEMNGTMPQSRFDYALRCGETVTGLIGAAARMRPTGLEGMEPKSIRKKMKDKAFAASVNRDNIRQCADAGLELDEFLALAIEAMRARAAEPDLRNS